MLLHKNKKALFNYEVVEKFLAGISLYGYEVKAIKEKNVSFEGAYISVQDSGLGKGIFVVGLNIGKYSKQSQEHDDTATRRPRQLLLNKIEIAKIARELAEKGKTAVPLALLLKNGKIKLEIAVVKGRKKYEKKGVLKERQIKSDLEKLVRGEKLREKSDRILPYR